MSSETESSAVNVDTVIVGGGIQGLWLLADLLDNGYEAVLLERRRPGFGQTGHSHVFLHEGHMFASAVREQPHRTIERVQSVADAHRLWQVALTTGRLSNINQLKSPFYVGWLDPLKATGFEEFCRRTNLSCDPLNQAPVEFGRLKQLERFYKSEAVCLESTALLNALLDYKDVRRRVACCREVSVKHSLKHGFELVAACTREKLLTIHARSLVLSAGSGNEKLVNGLFDQPIIAFDSNAIRQQTVKTYMLVVRHPKGSAAPVAGMFPDSGGIFVVSRQDPQGRTIWLVGDRQRELVSNPGEITTFDAATWFKTLKVELEHLFPSMAETPENYEWGIYEATKAEPWTNDRRFVGGGAFPWTYRIHKHATEPIWLTWPTLLTFAPKVANIIAEEIMKAAPPTSTFGNGNLWDEFCVALTSADCRWKTTPLLSWTDFKRCFS